MEGAKYSFSAEVFRSSPKPYQRVRTNPLRFRESGLWVAHSSDSLLEVLLPTGITRRCAEKCWRISGGSVGSLPSGADGRRSPVAHLLGRFRFGIKEVLGNL